MAGPNDRIGVGIIGANAHRGWARAAHIPAIGLVPQFALVALSTSRAESAREAAAAYGVDLAFDDHHALVTRPEVDLVVVSVKTPHHYEMVSAAIAAGKHVFCEWPLGRTLEETRELAAQARERGVKAIIGLQARSSPAIRYLRHLRQQGLGGRLLSVEMRGRVPAFGAEIDVANAYINDRNTGASLLTISFAHSVDALCWSLGELGDISATLAVRQPRITIRETGGIIARTSPDQVIVSATLPDGAPVSVHFQGGSSPRGNFDWHMTGGGGHMAIAAADGNLQMSRAELSASQDDVGAMEVLAVPDIFCPVPSAPAGPAYNLAQTYARLALELGGKVSDDPLPDFDCALRRHEMIASIERAAETGVRQLATP